MPPISWTGVEDTIRNWVKTASGLSDAAVYFANQLGPQYKLGPFIAIRLEGATALGAYDSVEFLQDLTRPAGTEIELRTYAPREFVVELTSFAGAVVTQTGREVSKDLLNRVRNAIGLESTTATFNAAGLACFDIGSVRNVAGLLETGYEGRALLDLRFYCGDSLSEFTGYISQCTPSGTLST
jgi:hypothetical protein